MSEKKRFLLRLDPELYAAIERWAADELRSVNAQVEYLLKDSVQRSGRLKNKPETKPETKPENEPNAREFPDPPD